MSACAEKRTAEEFRKKYADTKPCCELLNGEAVKAFTTRLHAVLQLS
jgi:hypothetical protein